MGSRDWVGGGGRRRGRKNWGGANGDEGGVKRNKTEGGEEDDKGPYSVNASRFASPLAVGPTFECLRLIWGPLHRVRIRPDKSSSVGLFGTFSITCAPQSAHL